MPQFTSLLKFLYYIINLNNDSHIIRARDINRYPMTSFSHLFGTEIKMLLKRHTSVQRFS